MPSSLVDALPRVHAQGRSRALGGALTMHAKSIPIFTDQSDDRTWRVDWIDDTAGVVHRAASTKIYTDLTVMWRWRESDKWEIRAIQRTATFGMVRPCNSQSEFEAVVREYLELAPKVGALSGGGGYL